jgi:threonine dehydratase
MVVTVDDPQIISAVKWTFEHAKIVAEPSGAASVAAALDGSLHSALSLDQREPVVAIVSGGNIAIDKLHSLCA